MQKLYVLTICVLLFLGFFILSSNKGTITMTEKEQSKEKPVVLLKTNLGDIKLELFPDKAPATVENFLKYVADGHYVNTIFHRVIDGFMVQGGGYTSDLKSKPTRESIKNEANNGVSNKKGTIAMARTQDINSATAQFFINVVDNPFLDYRGDSPHEYGYCVFGTVIDGMDVVEKIRDIETTTQGPYQDLPVKPIEILSAKKVTL